MPREQKYTKTIALRVTAEEYALIMRVIESGTPMGHDGVPHKATDVLRNWLRPYLDAQRHYAAEQAKRAEAAAKRAAKKAAANVDA